MAKIPYRRAAVKKPPAPPAPLADFDSSALAPLFGPPRFLAIAAVVMAVATLLVFGDLLFGGGDRILSIPGADLATQFVGWSEFTFGEMARGNLPLWNPHLFSGAPCLGGFQEALLYPPVWIHLFLPLPQAMNWGIAMHVFMAGLFTYAWLARRAIHPVAAMLGGMVFMFGGVYFMHITPGHLPNLRTMVWAPVIFLAIDDLTTTRSIRGVWLGSAAVAMSILAGHVQYVYYTAIISTLYAVLHLRAAPSRPRAIVGLAIMGLGGAALSAVQLFTGLAATAESTRSQLPFDKAMVFAFPPENLLTTVIPNIFGRVVDGYYWGRWFLWEDSLFIGVAACSLAIYGALGVEKKKRRFAVTFVVICLVLAFGSYTPLYRPLYHLLPGFSSFRGVSKFVFLAGLFMANLSAVGMDRALGARQISRKPALFVGAAAVAAAALGAVLWVSANSAHVGVWGVVMRNMPWSNPGYQYGQFGGGDVPVEVQRQTASDAAAQLCYAAGVAVFVAIAWFGARTQRRLAYALSAVAALELLIFAWGNRPTFDVTSITGMEKKLRVGLLDKVDAMRPDRRVYTPFPCVVLGADGYEAWGNDPMVLRRYAQFMGPGLSLSSEEGLTIPVPTWGMARVAAYAKSGAPTLLSFQGKQLDRAQLIGAVKVIEDPPTLLKNLVDPSFDPARTVLVEKPIAQLAPADVAQPKASLGEVHLKDPDPSSDSIDVTADVKSSCLLLITDNYSAGWRARSLDESAPRQYEVVRADYTLRGIPLQPGKHHILVYYLPMAYVVGKWTTICSLLVYIGSGIWFWKFRKR